MNEREYAMKLELDLKAMTERAERAERARDINHRMSEGQAKYVRELEAKLEQMRQLACEIAKRTNQQQRIAAGEKE